MSEHTFDGRAGAKYKKKIRISNIFSSILTLSEYVIKHVFDFSFRKQAITKIRVAVFLFAREGATMLRLQSGLGELGELGAL